jgi:hypothetical protein
MKYIDEFRDQNLARRLAGAIAAEVAPEREYRLMEFCGGHTHAIFRYGVQDLMPGNLRFVHGPGCPVCVLPTARIDEAIALAEQHGVTLCTYADMMRVPGGDRRSLLKAKALVFGFDGQIGHVFGLGARVAGNEIRDQRLLQAMLFIDPVIAIFKFVEMFEGGFPHDPERGVGGMLGGYLEAATNVPGNDLFHIFLQASIIVFIVTVD